MENFFNYIKFAFLRSFSFFSSVERMPPNGDLLRSMKNFHHEKIIVTKPKLECSGECFFLLPRCKLFYSPGEKIEKIITSFR